MKLPCPIHHNRRWGAGILALIMCPFFAAVGFYGAMNNDAGMVVKGVQMSAERTTFTLALGAVFLSGLSVWILLLFIRRLFYGPYVVVDKDHVDIGYDFMEYKKARVNYSELRAVYEFGIDGDRRIVIKTHTRKSFDIQERFFPNAKLFDETRDLIFAAHREHKELRRAKRMAK